jgi:transcriptional regulator with XRE-family HTH domain
MARLPKIKTKTNVSKSQKQERPANANGVIYIDEMLQELVEQGHADEVRMVIGLSVALKARRNQLGFSITDTARQLGINKNTLTGIEKGKPSATVFVLVLYAKFLGMRINIGVDLGSVVSNKLDEIKVKPKPKRTTTNEKPNQLSVEDWDDGLGVD